MARDIKEGKDAQAAGTRTGQDPQQQGTQQQGAGSDSQALQGSRTQSPQGEGEREQRGQGRRGELQQLGYGRNPFALMQQLSDEMDSLFESVFYGTPVRGRRSQSGAGMPTLWSPEIDIRCEGNQLRVCVDLPGVPKDSVKVDLNDGILTIQGERSEERSEGEEQRGFRRTERRYGSFYRSIALPESVDVEQANARMKDGVLEVTIPMAEQPKGRSLEIKE